MSLLLSLSGRIGPVSYALWSLGVFFSQHLIALVVLALEGHPLAAISKDWQFYAMPLPTLARHYSASDAALILALGCLLTAAWALVALAFRRAADADVSGWNAAFVLAPLVQIPVILLLCMLPSRIAESPIPVAKEVSAWRSATVAQGLVFGVALTVLGVAVAALLFGSYGFGVFVVSPFIIGATTGYFANHTHDIGASHTSKLVVSALLLGAIALVVTALEGILCVILAAPLAIGTGLLGGQLGRAIAVRSRRPPRQALSGLALLPLVFTIEKVLPPAIQFDTQSTIHVSAPPAAVWKILVHTDLSEEPVAAPFRLGIAYPVRGAVIGEGIGAMRIGEFSTGRALERVTAWIPNRKLAFIMLNEVAAMHELSPYAHVHAPHVVGYFRTTDTSFELASQAGGGTELIERTSHELRLEPVLYWLPLARWVVQENNARVLGHIKRKAETSQLQAGP